MPAPLSYNTNSYQQTLALKSNFPLGFHQKQTNVSCSFLSHTNFGSLMINLDMVFTYIFIGVPYQLYWAYFELRSQMIFLGFIPYIGLIPFGIGGIHHPRVDYCLNNTCHTVIRWFLFVFTLSLWFSSLFFLPLFCHLCIGYDTKMMEL